MYTDDPLMIKMSGGKPTIRINPKAAKKLGIEEGDKVEVYNDRGHMVAPARLDEAVPPHTIQAWFGWRHKHYEDDMYSEMLLQLSGHEATDRNPLSVQWWNDCAEQVPGGHRATCMSRRACGTPSGIARAISARSSMERRPSNGRKRDSG